MAVFGKLAYDEGATVGTLLAVRFALAAALFWALVAGGRRAREVRALRPPRRRRSALALGACGYALQAGCYFAALERIDASLLSLLLYTFPAIVAVAAVALGRERLDARRAGRARRSRSAGSCSSSRAPARARSTRSAPRSGSAPRSSTAPTSSSATASPGACAPQRARGARLHRRGGDADGRLGAARRAAPGRADGRRLGLARVPRRRLDRRRDQPLLRRPAARRADDRLDPRHRRAARDRAARVPRLRRDARRACSWSAARSCSPPCWCCRRVAIRIGRSDERSTA